MCERGTLVGLARGPARARRAWEDPLKPLLVTGLGALTASGDSPAAIWDAFASGDTSAIRRLPLLQDLAVRSKIGAELDFDAAAYLGEKAARSMDLVSAVALWAGDRAFESAGLARGDLAPERFGICFGTGYAGERTRAYWYEVTAHDPDARVGPLCIPKAMHNAATFHLADRFQALGDCRTVSSACSSSALAVASAVDLLRAGRLDACLVATSETPIVASLFRAWKGLRVMATRNDDPPRAFRPFDKDRRGFVMGEGAAAILLETEEHARSRGAKVFGEVLGYGNNLDATSITAPSPARQTACMKAALVDAGLFPADVGHVVAHGSGTSLNDRVEAESIQAVFAGCSPPPLVTNSKPGYGHTMGATGLLEFVVALETIKRGRVPAIPNLDERAEECPIRVAAAPGEAPASPVFLVNSFGFGGTNVTVAARGVPGEAAGGEA